MRQNARLTSRFGFVGATKCQAGGIDYSEQKLNYYHDKAVSILADFPDSPARSSLVMLADYIVERSN